MYNYWILAQTEHSDAETGQPSVIAAEKVGSENQTAITVADSNNPPIERTTSKRPTSPMTWLPLVLIFIVFYFLIFRGPRKKQQQQKQMVQSLQKNDRVQTIGGIVGTIIDVKDNEITLKVDESNNTKIKIVSAAISRKLSDEIK